jgi:ribokinase
VSGSTDGERPLVIAVGSINADHQMRLPHPVGAGTTLASEMLLRASGGKGANVTVGVTRLGLRAALVGCVGDDDLAPLALYGPRGAGADLRNVERVGAATGLSTVLVQDDGSKSIVLALGANDEPHPALHEVCSLVHAAPDGSLLVVCAEVHPDLVHAVLDAAHDGVITVVDPAPPERVTSTMLRRAHHLLPDHSEASELSGVEVSDVRSALEAARALRQRGARCVHVKLPEGGAVCSSGEGDWVTRAPDDLAVVDTNGAGDAFAIGVTASLARGDELRDVVRLGTAASACAVGGWGAQASFPDESALAAMSARVSVMAVG